MSPEEKKTKLPLLDSIVFSLMFDIPDSVNNTILSSLYADVF